MAKKIIAVFVMCIVLVAALSINNVEAHDYSSMSDEEHFKSCFNNCHDDCKKAGSGSTQCEIRCDNDCLEKEHAVKLDVQFNN